MKKRIILMLVVVLVFGINLLSKEVTLGEKIKTETVTKISEILEKPESFLDKTVRVEGYIADGCMHKGTWIALAGDKEFQKLSVWHKEGKIKFPLDHRGKYGIVEGTVYPVQLTEEQGVRWLKHLAETHKQEVDTSKAKGGMKIYRINPIGAVIKDAK
ncbi:MAG: DUF4920 domain-containing protein [bacterium]|nr:DUF4920 domain-containing protein [bacterium]